jgi:hypothetical protein
MGPEMTGETSALDTLQFQAQQATNAAAAEGQANVESVKATGAGLLNQASTMASDALASAQVSSFPCFSKPWYLIMAGRQQSYLPGQGQNGSNTAAGSNNQGSGVSSQFQSGAATALSTAKEYISAAQAAAQPHVENVRSTIQPHIDSATAAAQPHIDRARETVQGYVAGGNPPDVDTKHA